VVLSEWKNQPTLVPLTLVPLTLPPSHSASLSTSTRQTHKTNTKTALPYELSVLIIILALCLFTTSIPRDASTSRSVSTTLAKLLAAPRSCVRRTMLSGFGLPCSTTVMTSAAKATGLRLSAGHGQSHGQHHIISYHHPSSITITTASLTIHHPHARKNNIALPVHLNILHPMRTPSPQQPRNLSPRPPSPKTQAQITHRRPDPKQPRQPALLHATATPTATAAAAAAA